LGDTLWTRAYGSADDEQGCDIEQVWDGGFIITGFRYPAGGPEDAYLVRMTSSGDTVWTRTFGTPDGSEMGASVTTSPDSGFVVATPYRSSGTPWHDLIKVDRSGNLVWGTQYSGIYGAALGSVESTGDGYILCGWTRDESYQDYIYVVRTDWVGDTLWTRAYQLLGYNYGHRARRTRDGGFIISVGAGDSIQPGHAGLMKVNSAGNVEWSKVFPETYLWYIDGGTDVVEAVDGGFVLVAPVRDSLLGYRVCLVKTDANGDTIWSRTPSTFGEGMCGTIIRVPDGYAAAGSAVVQGGYDDFYLLKTDLDGRAGIEEGSKPQVSSLTPQATIVRGVLYLPASSVERQASGILLDISGREVMELHLGPSDVSRLAPGVYFVVRGAQRHGQSVHKVLLTK
jgi:hypothetical protein